MLKVHSGSSQSTIHLRLRPQNLKFKTLASDGVVFGGEDLDGGDCEVVLDEEARDTALVEGLDGGDSDEGLVSGLGTENLIGPLALLD